MKITINICGVVVFLALTIGLIGCKKENTKIPISTQTQRGEPTTANIPSKELASCRDCLAGILVPLKDFQVVEDTEYTEVVNIHSTKWDAEKLPKEVIELWSKGYTCNPVPEGLGPAATPGGQLSVKLVRWECFLHHNNYMHLISFEQDKMNNLVGQGYSCKKIPCADDRGVEDYVWFCAK